MNNIPQTQEELMLLYIQSVNHLLDKIKKKEKELKKAKDVLHQIAEIYPKVTVLESYHGSMAYRKAMSAGKRTMPIDFIVG